MKGMVLGWLSVVSSPLLKGTLVPVSGVAIRTDRHHSLSAPRSTPLNPVVADVARWLQAGISRELDALGVTKGNGRPFDDGHSSELLSNSS